MYQKDDRSKTKFVQTFVTGQNKTCKKEDIICLSEKRPRKVKGSGAYRRWLPGALQRVCWGRRPSTSQGRRRIRSKRAVKARTALTASSAKAWTALMQGASSHVRNVRCAMAARFLQLQRRSLQDEPHANILICELAFDETETMATMDGSPNEIAHMMTLHIRLSFVRGLGSSFHSHFS